MKNRTLKIAVLGFAITVLTSASAFAQQQNDKERKGPPSIEELFKMMDENEDAKLSKKEIKGPLKSEFDKIDANEDGFLTAEELKKAPKPKGRERDAK